MVNHSIVRSRLHRLAATLLLAASGGLLLHAPAMAQGATSAAVTSPTSNPYAACNDGTSNVDRATCMKEAVAAKGEAQRGKLADVNPTYQQNALQRCDALPPSDKEACRLRILGAGTTSGSVANGGLEREIVIRNPSPVSTSAPAPAPAAGSGPK